MVDSDNKYIVAVHSVPFLGMEKHQPLEILESPTIGDQHFQKVTLNPGIHPYIIYIYAYINPLHEKDPNFQPAISLAPPKVASNSAENSVIQVI